MTGVGLIQLAGLILHFVLDDIGNEMLRSKWQVGKWRRLMELCLKNAGIGQKESPNKNRAVFAGFGCFSGIR
jgi:hypothetical protein